MRAYFGIETKSQRKMPPADAYRRFNLYMVYDRNHFEERLEPAAKRL